MMRIHDSHVALEAGKEAPDLSVVVPVFNEEDNVVELHRRLVGALTGSAEIIFVDDGSWDATYARLHTLAESRPAHQGHPVPQELRPDSGPFRRH